MLWSTDTCQNKVSADQYHATISRAQVYSSSRSRVSLKLTADQVLVLDWIVGSCHVKVAPYSFWTARELISKLSRWRELSISTLKSRAESRSKMPTNMASKFLKFVYR